MSHSNKNTISKVYALTAAEAEFAEAVDIQFSEELIATAEDLTVVWRHFRILDPQSRTIYGLPMENDGSEIKIPPPLTDAQKIQSLIVHAWFRAFVQRDDVGILRVETPLGGIIIRKTRPGECLHKFVTMDLHGDNNTTPSTAIFESTSRIPW